MAQERKVKLIVSGGQTGADRGGLDAALDLGMGHTGWCPRGRRSEDGIIPIYYKLRETESSGYEERTLRNVQISDGTLIFVGHEPPHPTQAWRGGSGLTRGYCVDERKPYVALNAFTSTSNLIACIKSFLQRYQPVSINIAGNRESKAPGIQEIVRNVLYTVLKED